MSDLNQRKRDLISYFRGIVPYSIHDVFLLSVENSDLPLIEAAEDLRDNLVGVFENSYHTKDWVSWHERSPSNQKTDLEKFLCLCIGPNTKSFNLSFRGREILKEIKNWSDFQLKVENEWSFFKKKGFSFSNTQGEHRVILLEKATQISALKRKLLLLNIFDGLLKPSAFLEVISKFETLAFHELVELLAKKTKSETYYKSEDITDSVVRIKINGEYKSSLSIDTVEKFETMIEKPFSKPDSDLEAKKNSLRGKTLGKFNADLYLKLQSAISKSSSKDLDDVTYLWHHIFPKLTSLSLANEEIQKIWKFRLDQDGVKVLPYLLFTPLDVLTKNTPTPTLFPTIKEKIYVPEFLHTKISDIPTKELSSLGMTYRDYNYINNTILNWRTTNYLRLVKETILILSLFEDFTADRVLELTSQFSTSREILNYLLHLKDGDDRGGTLSRDIKLKDGAILRKNCQVLIEPVSILPNKVVFWYGENNSYDKSIQSVYCSNIDDYKKILSPVMGNPSTEDFLVVLLDEVEKAQEAFSGMKYTMVKSRNDSPKNEGLYLNTRQIERELDYFRSKGYQIERFSPLGKGEDSFFDKESVKYKNIRRTEIQKLKAIFLFDFMRGKDLSYDQTMRMTWSLKIEEYFRRRFENLPISLSLGDQEFLIEKGSSNFSWWIDGEEDVFHLNWVDSNNRNCGIQTSKMPNITDFDYLFIKKKIFMDNKTHFTNISTTLSRSFQQSLKLVAAQKVNEISNQAFTEVAKRIGVPGFIIEDKTVQDIMEFTSPILLRTLLEIFPNAFPSSNLLKEGCNLAITTGSMKHGKAILDSLRPVVMEVTSQAQKVIDIAIEYEETQESQEEFSEVSFV